MAVPVLPSSPGAVQVSVILLAVGLLVARFVTAAGATLSTITKDRSSTETQAPPTGLVREAWTRVMVRPAGAWYPMNTYSGFPLPPRAGSVTLPVVVSDKVKRA